MQFKDVTHKETVRGRKVPLGRITVIAITGVSETSGRLREFANQTRIVRRISSAR